MTPDEISLLNSTMNDADIGLEFGMGGSTLLAAKAGFSEYSSVESSREWMLKCASVPEISTLIASGKWKLCYCDIGPVKELGYPANDNSALKWPAYHGSVWSKLSSGPDFVFVDGRFRVACALQAAARCERSTKILIHDYHNRPHYHAVEEFLEPVASSGTLQVFELTKKPEPKPMIEAISEYALDPR